MRLSLIAAAIAGALAMAIVAGTPAFANKVPSCPEGYVEDSRGSGTILCTRTVEHVVTKEVPGPERVVEKIVYVDRPVEVVKEVQVPGPERVVVKWKTKTKRVVQWRTKVKVKRVVQKQRIYVNCPVKGSG